MGESPKAYVEPGTDRFTRRDRLRSKPILLQRVRLPIVGVQFRKHLANLLCFVQTQACLCTPVHQR